jgi:hypothetical protein
LVVTDKRTAHTVKNTWVKAPRIVFGWALNEKLIGTNPFADVSIRMPKKPIGGRRRVPNCRGEPKRLL